jgi:hypothetical protein
MPYLKAMAHCANMSVMGTLVYYPTQQRQQEVELAFRKRGWLRNGFIPFYWIGLRVSPYEQWPNFQWPNSVALDDSEYSHWGTFMPGSHREPNNIYPPENCAGGNYSESYDDLYGWADAGCFLSFPFICENPLPPNPPPSPNPPAGSFFYQNFSETSSTKGAAYLLQTDLLKFEDAKWLCQQQGSSVVVWESAAEQGEVEQAMLAQGGLHRRTQAIYWLGYTAALWPFFKPLVKTNSSYEHWGTLMPGNRKEPNQATGPEMCTAANYSMSYTGAWGWADASCSRRYPVICKLPADPPPPASAPPNPPDGPAPTAPYPPDYPDPPAPPPPSPPRPPKPKPPPPGPRAPQAPRRIPPSPHPPSPPPPSPKPPPPPRPQPPPPSPTPPSPMPPVRLRPVPPPTFIIRGAASAPALVGAAARPARPPPSHPNPPKQPVASKASGKKPAAKASPPPAAPPQMPATPSPASTRRGGKAAAATPLRPPPRLQQNPPKAPAASKGGSTKPPPQSSSPAAKQASSPADNGAKRAPPAMASSTSRPLGVRAKKQTAVEAR